jgi:hypothetical protein
MASYVFCYNHSIFGPGLQLNSRTVHVFEIDCRNMELFIPFHRTDRIAHVLLRVAVHFSAKCHPSFGWGMVYH